MRALANIVSDLFFQLRVCGGLGSRLWCVLSYYFFYGLGRLRGLNQGESRLGSLDALWRRGFPRRHVTVSWPPGMRLESDVFSACFMLKEMVADRMYENRPGFAPRPGQTVIDVGGHHGFFTLRAAARVGPKGRVLAVEAFPDNLQLLKKNIDANGLAWVSAVGVAASDSAGEAAFHVFNIVTGGSLVFKPGGTEDITVAKETLDNILVQAGVSRVDLIKIDVEGACLSVLAGARKTLEQRPRLVMEVEGGESEVDKVRSFLERLGYGTEVDGAILYAQA